MADAALTRLRVAQATRLPVTIEQIVEALEADEASKSLSADDVQAALAEWIEAGIVEELPADRYVHARVFLNDVERRVVANLAQPRTVEALQAAVRPDPNVGNLDVAALSQILAGVEERGLAKRAGNHDEGRHVTAAIAADDETIDLPREKARIVAERLSAPARAWQLDGDQWLMTKRAHDALRVT